MLPERAFDVPLPEPERAQQKWVGCSRVWSLIAGSLQMIGPHQKHAARLPARVQMCSPVPKFKERVSWMSPLELVAIDGEGISCAVCHQ
jgi:hypothetical protein